MADLLMPLNHDSLFCILLLLFLLKISSASTTDPLLSHWFSFVFLRIFIWIILWTSYIFFTVSLFAVALYCFDGHVTFGSLDISIYYQQLGLIHCQGYIFAPFIWKNGRRTYSQSGKIGKSLEIQLIFTW